MGLLPAVLVVAARRLSSSPETALRSQVWLALVASLAVPLAALLILAETALFRSAAELNGWASFATTMLVAHGWIGLFEGGLSTALVAALTMGASPASRRPAFQPALVCVTAALVLATLLLTTSSPLPDGYEFAAQGSGMEWLLAP